MHQVKARAALSRVLLVRYGGMTIRRGMSLAGFGYIVLDRIGESRDWKITVHAADGAVLRHCALTARNLTCGPPPPTLSASPG